MEEIQIVKPVPWITECYNIKEYFDEYHKILDEANGLDPHNEKDLILDQNIWILGQNRMMYRMDEGDNPRIIRLANQFDFNASLRNFFQLPDDLEGQLSKRSTPSHLLRNRTESIDSEISDNAKRLVRNNSIDGGSISQLDNEEKEDEDDPFCLSKLEDDCSIDLLTVEGELPPRELCESDTMKESGRITNWFAGAFMDGVIPEGGPEKLVTLASQAKELYKREIVKDYLRLRHRLLKYSSTVRMVLKEEKENSLEAVNLQEDQSGPCLRDIIFNIRIHRPFHKRTYSKKGVSRFPKHSQEILMLGSQKLSELKDAIECINDYYVHLDMSDNPDPKLLSTLQTSEDKFPSAFFYFNGTFFIDTRIFESKDFSETIKCWAKKYPLIGPMKTEKMNETILSDLKIRLGYPYAYQHLGNCEHLIVITDVRIVHRTDIQDPSRYPLTRVNPVKLTVICFACNLTSASWLIKDDPRLPEPYAHFCHDCVKSFFYDKDNVKIGDFKLYPFIDEFVAQTLKEKKLRSVSKSIDIKVHGESAQLIIKPFFE